MLNFNCISISFLLEFTAGRGKKDEMQTKDVEKSSPVPTSESTKQGIQTPAKKSSRGGSNSSTERDLIKNERRRKRLK